MNTVVLEVRSLADTLADTARAMNTGHAEPENALPSRRRNCSGKF